jgi:hypothetical protein
MDAVTSVEIRAWSKLNFAELGYAAAVPDPLEQVITWASDAVMDITGQSVAGMPAGKVSLAQRAILLLLEQMVLEGRPDYAETVNEPAISSFSAGDYSEQRRAPEEAAKLLNPNPALHSLLWNMMTEEKRAEWLQTIDPEKFPAVAFEGSEVIWDEWDLYGGGELSYGGA